MRRTAIVLSILLSGCGSEVDVTEPVSVDDASLEAGTEASVEAGTEASVEASTEASVEAGAPVDPVPPAAVVSCMSATPYVESSCSSVTIKRWAHPAKRCQYSSPKGTLTVDVADPTASRVAIWILGAAREVPWVANLEKTEPAKFLEVMKIMAVDIMFQSGRIFPIQGDVGEDMGTGYVAYSFTDGVADGCPTGEPHCFCRINSLTRGMLCAYRAHLGVEKEADCRARVGYGKGNTAAWYAECLGNHDRAWDRPSNPHFAAKLWSLLSDAGMTGKPTGAQVTAALYGQLGLKAGDLAAFCK